ncbi:LysR substrate-binding domain-containing protein [Rhodospirillaceae bacterium SYSU D60014]|uniref:LysR substrate-binding domain-containing protein n=1 Tax=Virgifigura deserti TaxID=2268457 RepID=UPI000E6610D3
MWSVNYTQLRAFNAVARARSFSKAASLLGITQPAVTVQVKALETAYAVHLFQRQGRSVVPTESGQALFALTQQMFLAEERIGEFLTSSTTLEAGSLALAADGPHIALDVVSRFARRYPRVQVSVRLGNTAAAVQELLEQRVDAAVVANPKTDPRTIIVPIHRRGMLALVPRDHPLATQSRLKLRDIAGHPVILREIGSTTRRLLDEAARRANVALAPTLELGSREAMREAVARGLGIGFLFERENEGDDRTVAVPLQGLSDINVDTVTCLKSNRRSAVVRAVIEIAEEIAARPLTPSRS